MKKFWVVVSIPLLLASCGNKDRAVEARSEDTEAKKMLQGIWLDEVEEDPSFRVAGDTIYYPDSISMPVYFKIVDDTLILEGSQTIKYPIVKQDEHLFQFVNGSGEVVKLVKSESIDDQAAFDTEPPIALNQRQTIKRDTVINVGQQRYHCYVQVNPTTYKVYKTSYNDDGVAGG